MTLNNSSCLIKVPGSDNLKGQIEPEVLTFLFEIKCATIENKEVLKRIFSYDSKHTSFKI